MSDDLTLEKLRVKERLEAVEEHMKSGEENRKVLMTGFKDLQNTVTSIETTLFGVKGKGGVITQMEALLKIADGIKWILNKIFMAVCTAVALAVMPSIFKYLSEILTKHSGG